jgi:hypothetical protein
MRLVGRNGMTIGIAGAGLPTILAACSGGDDPVVSSPSAAASGSEPPEVEGTAIVGDVLDFALTSDEWAGAFGWVTFRMHEAVADGEPAYFIRTDASDEAYAAREQLVFVPKIAGLAAAGLTGDAWIVTGAEAPVVLSSVPGRKNYTPAWNLHEVTWKGSPGRLRSADDVAAAAQAGDLDVTGLGVVLNGPVVAWEGGEMPVDTQLTEYLGEGQLVSAPDTEALEVTFKLHECFPGSRYIVCDTSLAPMAEGMRIATSPELAGTTDAGATGRTNVFMGGVEGSGPMDGQPSVFDSSAGDAAWSPYWDHYTYVWAEDVAVEVLEDQDQVWAARDAGDLEEFPGTPDTDGTVFTVNCPVPVIAPNTFAA